jgi:hypothetical protein
VDNLARFCQHLIRDYALLAVVAGLGFGFWRGEAFGASVAAGCLWLALNMALLGWVMGAVLQPAGSSRLLVFALACAKIPAAYLLLYWLFSLDCLEPMGLAAGLAMLPVAIVFSGLRNLAATNSQEPPPGFLPRG